MIEVPDYLEPWLTTQRWFAGKSRAPRLEIIGGFVLETAEAAIRVHLVLDHAENPVLYQVPLSERRAPLPDAERAIVAERSDDRGALFVYDGPHDPAFAEALIRLMLDEGTAGSEDGSGRIAAFGHRDLAGDLRIVSSRVLGGEQSNTSIVFETTDAGGAPAMPIICKLFRTLRGGENPDVVLTAALGAASSGIVPRSVGHLTGRWPDGGTLDGLATGHLAFAQEFVPGVEDAWRVATAAVERGEDFSEQARELGETIAAMHEALARVLPSRATTPADIAVVVAGMRARFEQAVRQLPSLGHYRDRLDAVYRKAQTSPWPSLQRVHGDLHLGQVLAVPGRGWMVLDFEGEPLRSMRERAAPDSPLRDVAGMLRSFDYAAGSFALAHPGRDASGWAADCRQAFLDGYIARSGRDLRSHRALLDAFEIDKALYEAVYEARNRPAWLGIPIEAIARLIERGAQLDP